MYTEPTWIDFSFFFSERIWLFGVVFLQDAKGYTCVLKDNHLTYLTMYFIFTHFFPKVWFRVCSFKLFALNLLEVGIRWKNSESVCCFFSQYIHNVRHIKARLTCHHVLPGNSASFGDESLIKRCLCVTWRHQLQRHLFISFKDLHFHKTVKMLRLPAWRLSHIVLCVCMKYSA